MLDKLKTLVDDAADECREDDGELYGIEEALKDVAKRLRIKFIGNGSFRAAFLHENVVYKVPLDSEGVEHNFREYDLWKSSRGKLRSHLARVLGIEKDILLMEYAGRTLYTAKKFTYDDSYEGFMNWAYDELTKRYKRMGIPWVDADISVSNITVSRKVIDYAGC